jgi:predicted MFS family arabinose efflux permease
VSGRATPVDTRSATELGRLLTLALCMPASLAVLNALALSPFLSTIADELDTPVALLGQALTATGLLGASFGLVVGPAADRLGYRRLLLGGLAALVVCDFGTALAPTFPTLVLAQLVGGFSAATITPMAFSIAGSRLEGEARRRAIAVLYAAGSAGSIVGFPVIAVVADAASWRWSFVLIGVVAAGILALGVYALPRDTPSERSPLRVPAILAAYRPLLADGAMRLVYTAQFLRGVAWTGLLTYVGAFLVDELGGSVRLAGFLWLMLGPGFMFGSLLVNGRLRRVEPRRLFATTTVAMGLVIGALLIVQPPIVVAFATLFVIALFGGTAEVVLAGVVASETPAPQGTTMSLHSSVLRYGTATGALVGGGLLALGGYTLVGAGLPVIAAAGALVGWLSGRARTISTTTTVSVRE